MIQAPNIEALIQQRVDVALANRFRCELASPANGQPMSTEERRRTLTILFTEIAKGMGGVWGAVERKTGLGACHCKMIGIPASKAGQFMKRKKSYAKPRRASVAD